MVVWRRGDILSNGVVLSVGIKSYEPQMAGSTRPKWLMSGAYIPAHVAGSDESSLPCTPGRRAWLCSTAAAYEAPNG